MTTSTRMVRNEIMSEEQKQWDERVQRDMKTLHKILDGCKDKYDICPEILPPQAWECTAWEYMDPVERDKVLAGMLRNTVRRAKSVMPVYRNSSAYDSIDPQSITSLEQLADMPLLVKDGEHGFREKVRRNPGLLRPDDIRATMTPYLSGGTGVDEMTAGKATPTWITERDLDLESRALAHRCFLPGGFSEDMIFMSFYNLAHKGGEEIRRAVNHLYIKTLLPRRPEDSLEQCMDYIKRFGVSAIAAVPSSPKHANGAPKGGAVSFEDLYLLDSGLFGRESTGSQINTAFVTGFSLPDTVIRLAERNALDLFTTWGASEAIPGCTSTVIGPETRFCKHNNQHLLYFPHYLSVVDTKKERMRFCKPGDEGLLLVTTLARDGTIYLNYVIGDKAVVISDDCPCGRTTPVIGNIKREDNMGEFAGGGCRYA